MSFTHTHLLFCELSHRQNVLSIPSAVSGSWRYRQQLMSWVVRGEEMSMGLRLAAATAAQLGANDTRSVDGRRGRRERMTLYKKRTTEAYMFYCSYMYMACCLL